MLADFLAAVWPALPMFFFAGLCFVLAGGLWLFVVRRHELAIGADPVVPAVVEPATAVLPLPPKTHAARELPPWAPLHMYRDDSDTHVIARIPGATPEPTPPEDITDEQLVAVVDGLRELPCGPELVRFLDAVDADVRVLDAAGPRFATEPTPSPIREPDPLDVTQDIVVPFAEPTPAFDTTVQRADTRDLSGSLARAKEHVA